MPLNNPFVLAWKMVHSVQEMNKIRNGNGHGNGNGVQSVIREITKKTTKIEAVAPPHAVKESQVTFRTADNSSLTGKPMRVTRHSVIFELYNPDTTPQSSEVLTEFTVKLQDRTVYLGRAVVRNVVNTGTTLVCEVKVDELDWVKAEPVTTDAHLPGDLTKEFAAFLTDWQKFYKVLPEFKIVIADMQSFLHDFRLWLEHLELGLRTLPASERKEAEQKIMKQAGQLFVPAFDALHERLENVSEQISEELRPVHRIFSQRQLHPLVLCSPFAHRAYSKPLGYAGDYEMVNMITMNPYKGDTLFAKILNLWFLSQWPSKAHRNRLVYLKDRLESETLRVARLKRKARIFNFACGPAIEVQNFLADFNGSEQAELTLADFNEETLKYLVKTTGDIKQRLALRTTIHFVRKTAHQVIKEHAVAKRKGQMPSYDFIYCAGLFDYLPDSLCRQLMEIFYEWLAPDGLLAATNVDCDKPFRHMLDFVLDWHLIYRNVEGGKLLIPQCVPEDARRVIKDPTGVNIFIEARKPRHD